MSGMTAMESRMARAMRGLTQEELAEDAGIPVEDVIACEGGESSVADVRAWAEEIYDFYGYPGGGVTSSDKGDFRDNIKDAGGFLIPAEEFWQRCAKLAAMFRRRGQQ